MWLSREASLETIVFMDTKFRCSFSKQENKRCIDRIQICVLAFRLKMLYPLYAFCPCSPHPTSCFATLEGSKVSFVFRHSG